MGRALRSSLWQQKKARLNPRPRVRKPAGTDSRAVMGAKRVAAAANAAPARVEVSTARSGMSPKRNLVRFEDHLALKRRTFGATRSLQPWCAATGISV